MAQTPVELIEALCMADAISGREEKVRELLIQKIDGHCEWRVDARGNLLCHKKGKKPAQKRVMITAHMDEAGFMLTGIREDGRPVLQTQIAPVFPVVDDPDLHPVDFRLSARSDCKFSGGDHRRRGQRQQQWNPNLTSSHRVLRF